MGEEGVGLTGSASAKGKEEVGIRLRIGGHDLAICSHDLKRQDLVRAETVLGTQRAVSTSCCPSAIRRNRRTSPAKEGDVVEGSFRIYLEHLHSRAYTSCQPTIVTAWLCVVGEELKAAEMTREDAQGPGSQASADGVMARVSAIRQWQVAKNREIYVKWIT